MENKCPERFKVYVAGNEKKLNILEKNRLEYNVTLES